MTAQLLVGIPLLAAALGLAVARRGDRAAAVVALAGGLLTLTLAVAQAVAGADSSPTVSAATVGPLAVGHLAIPLHLLSDRTTALVAVAVAVVALAVQAYSPWYLHAGAHASGRYPVFAATVSLFTAAMLLVVQAGDLVLLLIGWEVMGWCSFLLIGHDSRREAARRAAVKAFLVTRVADLAFVIGIVILAVGAGSTDIPTVLAHWTTAAPGDPAARTLAMLCLLSGIAGKSALFPFHDWLPDAMEGPTPASALIHAATMVAAGTYVLTRLFPVLALAGAARLVLAVLCAVTMLGAAVLAFGQRDLKRLLAYSTLSQIAVMLGALAAAPAPSRSPAYQAGVVHLVSHAMFKALLFLALGWLAVLVGGTAVSRMAGSLHGAGRRLLAGLLGVGLLSLAGVPPLVGFLSKELVLTAAEEGTSRGGSGPAGAVGAVAAARSVGAVAAWVVLGAVLLTVPLTAAYCTRAWLVLTSGSGSGSGSGSRSGSASASGSRPGRGRETPEAFVARVARGGDTASGGVAVSAPARVAVLALGVLTLLGGLVVLSPLVGASVQQLSGLAVAVSLLLIAGAAAAVVLAGRGQPHADAAARLGQRRAEAMDAGLHADRLYVALVATPVLRVAHLVVAADRDVLDAYVRAGATGVRWAGLAGASAHRGKPSAYLLWVLLGMLAVGIAGVALW